MSLSREQLLRCREGKRNVIEDMRAAIRYIPNREGDLLAFMRQYLKAEPLERTAILDHLRRCMDGQPYPNPYAGGCCYTQEDVDRCDRLLEEYLAALRSRVEAREIARLAETVALKLDRLNGTCGEALLDGWRRDRLRRWVSAAAAEAGGPAPALSQRMW